MVHEARLYGNLHERTWAVDLEPEPEQSRHTTNPWELLATVELEAEAFDGVYPLDLEQ